MSGIVIQLYCFRARRGLMSVLSDPERAVQAQICPKPTDPETELMKLCLDQTITREDTGHLGIRDGHVETISVASMCRSAMACQSVRWQSQGMSSEPAESWAARVTDVPSLFFPIKNGDRSSVFKGRSKLDCQRTKLKHILFTCSYLYTPHPQ